MKPIKITNDNHYLVKVGDFLCCSNSYKNLLTKYKVTSIKDDKVCVDYWRHDERVNSEQGSYQISLFEWIVGRENSSITDKILKITIKRVKC